MLGFMFSGQGAQSPQMLVPIRSYGIDVSNVFMTISEGCGFDVEKLIETSTQEILSETQYTQIVIFAADMAYYEVLKNMGIEPAWVAGHSLGQYAALVAAGALDLYKAACLIKQRSILMGKVERQGKLCAISSPILDVELIQSLCDEIEDETKMCVRIALYNSNRQVVVGGEPEAISQLAEQLQELTNYKTAILPVGQAFHTPIMDEMLDEFQSHIDKLHICLPKVPIILNCDGQVLNVQGYEQIIKNEMRRQCNHPVLWTQTMQTMMSMDTREVMQVGPGRSLCGLLKNMTKDIKSYHMDDRKSCMKVIESINSHNTNKKVLSGGEKVCGVYLKKAVLH